jgi:hypothetical protein
MVALESVGVLEVVLLVLVAVAPTAGLVLTFVYDQPLVIKVVAAIVALPLALPWLANGLSAFLAELMPASLKSSMNVTAPAGGGLRLRVRDAREFRKKPLAYRLRRVYSFYALTESRIIQ